MAVEPGATPHWIESYRRRKNSWLRLYESDKNYIKNKQKEQQLKEKFFRQENVNDER